MSGTAFTTLIDVSVDGADGEDTINGSQLADTLDGGDDADPINR